MTCRELCRFLSCAYLPKERSLPLAKDLPSSINRRSLRLNCYTLFVHVTFCFSLRFWNTYLARNLDLYAPSTASEFIDIIAVLFLLDREEELPKVSTRWLRPLD